MVQVAIVYHSGFGHTLQQAEAVHRGAESVDGTEALLLTAEEATERLDQLDAADAIVFGSPTYMGSMSAGMKQFVEATAKKWFSRAWQDKVAGAFTNSSNLSGDKLNTLVGLMINAMQHGMLFVSLGQAPAENEQESLNHAHGPGPDAINRVSSSLGPMATSFQLAPGEGPPSGDLKSAEAYGRRVAEITLQLKRGRRAA